MSTLAWNRRHAFFDRLWADWDTTDSWYMEQAGESAGVRSDIKLHLSDSRQGVPNLSNDGPHIPISDPGRSHRKSRGPCAGLHPRSVGLPRISRREIPPPHRSLILYFWLCCFGLCPPKDGGIACERIDCGIRGMSKSVVCLSRLADRVVSVLAIPTATLGHDESASQFLLVEC